MNQNIRLLKAVVIVLGLIIIVGMGALLFAFAQVGNGGITKGDEPGETYPRSGIGANYNNAVLLERIQLPAGVQVLEIDLDGGRLALLLALSNGTEELAIYDLTTGERLGALAVAP